MNQLFSLPAVAGHGYFEDPAYGHHPGQRFGHRRRNSYYRERRYDCPSYYTNC